MEQYKHKTLGWLAEDNAVGSFNIYLTDATYKQTMVKELIENSNDWVKINKFKVGNWIKVIKLPTGKHWLQDTGQRIFKITGEEQDFLNHGLMFCTHGPGYNFNIVSHGIPADCMELADEQAIKDVLNMLVEHKTSNITGGVLFKDLATGNTSSSSADEYFKYIMEEDKIISVTDGCILYQNGEWAEIIENQFHFGDVTFTKIASNIYSTPHGNVTKEQLKTAIDYIQNPPNLASWALTIHDISTGNWTPISHMNEHVSIGFGCQKGTLKELINLYENLEDEFQVPDAYCIKRTPDNHIWLNEYINTCSYSTNFNDNDECYFCFRKDVFVCCWTSLGEACKFTLLTDEQFKKYVINKKS
jgi:phosphosulfolactate synthase (CoM biosynthesis protein A)